MSRAIVQIDGNNFYASCEQLINPSLKRKGLVVLSNNDGCIIARNSEARKMGIAMGQPYFKLKEKLNKLNINVKSSNYELYGDISNRLMLILRQYCEELEIYSIDEAFATLKRPRNKQLSKWGKELRSIVYQNIGIPITIGIGDTKVQAKIANHIAKERGDSSGIFDIGIIENKDDYLNRIRIDNVWGLGKKMSAWLKNKGISNAREFRDMSSKEVKNKYGIVGLRLQNELKGKSCINFKAKPSDRKELCVSRSFAYPIDSLEELQQAISKYAIIASNKLRQNNQFASSITVFTATNRYSNDFFRSEATARLEIPNDNTSIMLKTSQELSKRIYKPYRKLIKAGVILHKLQSNKYEQKILFKEEHMQKKSNLENLNKVIDGINNKHGRWTISWGTSILENDSITRREKLSHLKTTKIENIPTILAN